MKKLSLYVFAVITMLCCSWALFHQGFFRVHDFVHATRIVEMYRGFQDGQFPVRWSSNLGYGYGMPLFEFYAPLPYIVGAGFYAVGMNVVTTIKTLYLLANVFTLLGAFLLGKKLYGSLGGIVTAVTYTLAPYRAVNLYIRGAVSEAWAMIALPWVILGIVMILHKEKRGFWVLLGGLIVLFLSHNLTTLLFLPISVLLGVVLFFTLHKKASLSVKELKTALLPISGAYALAIGLCAFYMIPAVLEKDFTKIDSIFSGYFHYSHHFLYLRQFVKPFWGYGGSNWGPDDGISFFLGFGQLLGIALSLGMTAYMVLKKKQSRRVLWITGVLGLMGLSVFMSILRSKAVWDAIPLLSLVQFPWRWLSITSFLASLLVGAGVSLLPNKRFRIIATIFIAGVTCATTWSYFKPESFTPRPEEFYYTDTVLIQRQMSQILPDYIPKTMSDKIAPREKVFLVEGGDEKDVEVLRDKGHHKTFATSFSNPVEFNPLIASYPGWQATIDGQKTQLNNTGKYGSISLEVPAGNHTVDVWLGGTPVRNVSDVISASSVLLLIGVLSYVRYSRRTAA